MAVRGRSGKAVEGHRTPKRWRGDDNARPARSVMECASRLALCEGAAGCGRVIWPVRNRLWKKRWRATALQDADAWTMSPHRRGSVMECASRLALCEGAAG
jgi:hypothetical protein